MIKIQMLLSKKLVGVPVLYTDLSSSIIAADVVIAVRKEGITLIQIIGLTFR
jgi:hypothetical protein